MPHVPEDGQAASSFARRWVASAGVELAVDERGAGEGPTVLLVHGYPDTSALWGAVAAALADRYHVVTYDVRGAGASGAPESRGGYAIELLAEDLAAVARAVSPGRPVHVVGHDWGSVQAWEAVTQPGATERFASFTSLSGPALDHMAHWVRARLALRPRALGQLLWQGAHSWYVGALLLPGATLPWRLGFARVVRRALARRGALAPGRALAPTLPIDGARGVNLYRANVARRLRHPGERHTGVPVQLIVPSGDPYVTPALLDDTARWATRLWRRDVPGGHWLPRTAPERVAAWIGQLVDHAEGGPEPARLARHRVPATAPHHGATRLRDRGTLAVVTGAGTGVGREIALRLAARGAEVVAVDSDQDAAAETARRCRARGATATHQQVDICDPEAMQALAKAVEHDHGGADVLVHTTGTGGWGVTARGALDPGTAGGRRILHENLAGVLHGTRLFVRQMAAHREGGHIVTVAPSAAYGRQDGRDGQNAGRTAATAARWLSGALPRLVDGHDIAVTTIGPGPALVPGLVTTATRTTIRNTGPGRPGGEPQSRPRQRTERVLLPRWPVVRGLARAAVRAVERDRWRGRA